MYDNAKGALIKYNHERYEHGQQRRMSTDSNYEDQFLTDLKALYNAEENFPGQGSLNYEVVDPWMEYTKEGMDKLLQLRLEASDQQDIKTIIPNYIYDGTTDNAKKLANEISMNLSEKSLVVLNLFGKHWVGLAIEKDAETLDIQYMDSEQEMIPAALKEQLINQITINCPGHNIQFTDTELEAQKYNCGPSN